MPIPHRQAPRVEEALITQTCQNPKVRMSPTVSVTMGATILRGQGLGSKTRQGPFARKRMGSQGPRVEALPQSGCSREPGTDSLPLHHPHCLLPTTPTGATAGWAGAKCKEGEWGQQRACGARTQKRPINTYTGAREGRGHPNAQKRRPASKALPWPSAQTPV